ncbi:MAG: peptidylprolyl isomerase [Planctomycetes bacterium]|nr:peptidylprolyl isomerase [Planctomycetota bacterium]
MKIARGCRVVLSYELFDRAGEVLETSEEGEPMEYVHGADEIAPALERALAGKQEGDKVRVTLPPEDAFGAIDPGLIVSVPRSEIPPEFQLSVGEYLPIELEDAPEDLTDEEVEFRIVEVGESEVVLDANHPLAGETVTFALQVVSVT